MPVSYLVVVQDDKGKILGRYHSDLYLPSDIHKFLEELGDSIQITRTRISVLFRAIVIVLA